MVTLSLFVMIILSFVFLSVLSTMFHMCTMLCMHTLTGTMWLSRVWPSKLLQSLVIWIIEFQLVISGKCLMRIWYMNPCRFFKESSEEEREHAEMFMEYQVIDNSPSISVLMLHVWKLDAEFVSLLLTKPYNSLFCFLEQAWRESEVAIYFNAIVWVWSCRERRCTLW